MSALVFYTNPMSRGRIARWMLEELGQPYETRILGYGPEMKSPDYLALNPMGKVPTVVHDGRVITECAAICACLAEAFPEAGLGPKLEERAGLFPLDVLWRGSGRGGHNQRLFRVRIAGYARGKRAIGLRRVA